MKQKMILLTAVILFSGFYANAQFGGGSGTQEDPYKLSSAYHLSEIHQNLDGTQNYANEYFVLTNDITLGGSATPWTPIGTRSSGLPFLFCGNIDGQGHTIKNMHITKGNSHCGFIAYLAGSIVCNLHFTGVNIETQSEYTGNNAGALVGTMGGCTIVNCSAEGVIKGTNMIVGGLIGNIMGSNALILNCYGRVNATSNTHAGGLIGTAPYDRTSIINCYTTGSVTGNLTAGGILGSGEGDIISNCYASGDVKIVTTEDEPYIGGIVGYCRPAGYVDNYWNTNAAQTINGVTQDPKTGGINNAVGKTSSEMKAASFVTLLNSNKQSISGLPTGYSASNWKAYAGNSNQGYPLLVSSTALSLKEVDIQQQVSVYPVPAQSHVYLETTTQMEHYALYDITGVCLLLEQSVQMRTEIDIQELPAGIYLLRIATAEGTTVRKIIKN